MNAIEDHLIAKEELRYTRDEVDAFLGLLVTLTPRELLVLRSSLLGRTQQEIGRRIGRHQSQVSRIYNAARMKLGHRRLT